MRLLLVDVPGDPAPWDLTDPETCYNSIPAEYRGPLLIALVAAQNELVRIATAPHLEEGGGGKRLPDRRIDELEAAT